MISKSRVILNIFYRRGLIYLLLLLLFNLKVNADTKIIAKDGDTLLKLSKRYGVSLKQLMYKNNYNDANEIVEGKVILIPFNNNANNNINNNANNNINEIHLKYKVREGDTLYSIARKYQVNVTDIISLNKLNDSSYLKTNQSILIPKGAIYRREVIKKDLELARKKVFYHQTAKGERLSDIAQIHNVTEEKIIFFNNLNISKEISPNIKLRIRENSDDRWRKYGSLLINWAEWRYLDGDYINQVKNKKNGIFFIAISCKRRALNNTLEKSYWTNWYFPTASFEFKLINDFCDQDYKL